MSGDNTTMFSFNAGYPISTGVCMMSVRNVKDKADIYIPFEWLHKGISIDNVERWAKIGNDLLFPATITKEKIDLKKILSDGNPSVIVQFYGLKIKCRPAGNKRYVQCDCIEVVDGSLIEVTKSGDDYRTRTNVLKNNYGNRGGSSWNGYASDHVLIETGENLLDYINRELGKPKSTEKVDEDFNSFKVRIYCSTAISQNHKLAILTFYRFLWSNLYDGIVVNTLKLIDLGCDPWSALYYTMSTKKYESYYGLTMRSGFKSMEAVRERLKANDSINDSFSCTKANVRFTSMLSPNLVYAVAMFTTNTDEIDPSLTFKVKCITDKLITYTKGKIYKATDGSTPDKYLVFQSDDYCNRSILKSNFRKLE